MSLIRVCQSMDHRILNDRLYDQLRHHDRFRLRIDLVLKIKLSVKPDPLDLSIALDQRHLLFQRDKLCIGDTRPKDLCKL